MDTMAPVSLWPVLLLLSVSLGFLPASSQGETPHEKFQRQHVDYPKTSPDLDDDHYCNLMMRTRGMTDRVCKALNTFINGPADDVDATCTNGGHHVRGDLYDSIYSFLFVSCKVRGSQRPPCNYEGWSSYSRIEVACTNKLPVHFAKIL